MAAIAAMSSATQSKMLKGDATFQHLALPPSS
jgi:hypothetical protein